MSQQGAAKALFKKQWWSIQHEQLRNSKKRFKNKLCSPQALHHSDPIQAKDPDLWEGAQLIRGAMNKSQAIAAE